MNRNKTIRHILIFVAIISIIAGSALGIKFGLRARDPNWQVAKAVCEAQIALQHVDPNSKLESFSEVTSYEITRAEGPSIYYFCCVTSYLTEKPVASSGLNKEVLSLIVDLESLENSMECKVGRYDAVMGEFNEQTYLCWTISSKYSCVITFTPGTVTEKDIFRIAESVEP